MALLFALPVVEGIFRRIFRNIYSSTSFCSLNVHFNWIAIQLNVVGKMRGCGCDNG